MSLAYTADIKLNFFEINELMELIEEKINSMIEGKDDLKEEIAIMEILYIKLEAAMIDIDFRKGVNSNKILKMQEQNYVKRMVQNG